MALNMSDPYIRAERTPPEIADLGRKLCAAFGVGPDAFGCKGNEFHKSGFHRSRDYCEYSSQSPYGRNDYSVRGTRNKGGRGDNCGAIDFTPGEWGTPDNRQKMITITKRLRAAARRNDSRLADWYEFAGTEDGRNVVTFYAQGGGTKDPFDPSHLDHLHGSKYRDALDRPNTGLFEVIMGLDDGAREEDEHMSMGAIPLEAELTSISVPGGNLGGGDRQKYLALCNQTRLNTAGTERLKYALRIYSTKGDDAWTPITPQSALVKFENGKVQGFPLPIGTRCVSIYRAPIGTDGKVYDPLGTVPDGAYTYDGPLQASIEG